MTKYMSRFLRSGHQLHMSYPPRRRNPSLTRSIKMNSASCSCVRESRTPAISCDDVTQRPDQNCRNVANHSNIQ